MRMNRIKILTLMMLLVLLAFTTTNIHDFGSPGTAGMDYYFIEHGQEETDSNNIVASILFDYRALDTLGEATVLFTAATSIFLVFRRYSR